MHEHRIIEQVLNCLEMIANRAEANRRVDTQAVAKALEFFRTLVDRCHHWKEEALLFPMLETKGIPREGETIGVMLIERDQGRSHVRAMAAAVQNLQEDSPSAREQFIEHARAYVELLRQHIHHEDSCLFTMADEALGANDQQLLMASFAKVDQEDIGPEFHARCVQLANELADLLGVSKVAESRDGAASDHCRGNLHSIV